MDPQVQAFTPYGSNNETWRLQSEVTRIAQSQAEHAERIARLERRADDDARMKSVWGQSSPFPSVLSGTPQQGPVQHPPVDRFQNFDDDATNLMSSLHLDAEDEPRSRGMGATSRANSVRFDESANQNHFATHSTRPSMDYMSRTSSGLGGFQLSERTSSHKSEGRASSVHSLRSAASGRANSFNLDTSYVLSDPNRSPIEVPGFAPGLLLLGSVPAIIRCWMNTNFKHDALLYAAVCTGSYKSFLDLRLIQKLGFEHQILTEDDVRTVNLPVFFPEAVPHPSSSRSSSPAPQLPTLTVSFQVVDNATIESDSRAIQIFLGSDVLRAHNADILFSSNSMTLFDDDRSKLSIPLVRPESEASFNSLYVTTGNPQTAPQQPVSDEQPREQLFLNGLGQGSSGASLSSAPTSPPPGKYRPPGALTAEAGNTVDAAKAGASGSDGDLRAASRQSSASRPPLSMLDTRAEAPEQHTESGPQNATPSRPGNSPAIWNNWRRDGAAATTTSTPQTSGLDWANAGRNRDSTYQRRDTGIKVLKPKSASRTASTSFVSNASPADGRSRFFDEGKRRDDSTSVSTASAADKEKENRTPSIASTSTAASTIKTKANPIGGASAFSWLNSGDTTASSQKRRRLGNITSDADSSSIRSSTEAFFDQHGLRAHAASSPSSSPQPQAPVLGSEGASSPSSTRNTSPPSAIPGHVQSQFGSGSNQSEGGASPSGEFAKISIESQSGSGFVSESEGMGLKRVGGRSASPAKRSAADMDDDEMEFAQPRALDQQKPQNGESESTLSTNAGTRFEDATMSTSATSLQSKGQPPPFSEQDDDARWRKGSSATSSTQVPPIDEQVSKVSQMVEDFLLDEGTRGCIVAKAWLQRVLCRTTENMSPSAKTQYPKEAREGPVGPVDNSTIVPPGGLESQLKDHVGQRFVPLKPGLQRQDDFEIVPENAWGYMMSLYPPPPVGPDGPTQKIVRYAHNTTETPGQNIQWEYYPPTITIRKVPQSAEQPRSAVAELQKQKACASRGQKNPDDAIRLVSSRSEKFQYFLRRAKEAASIPLTSKVKIFKQLEPKAVSTDEAANQPNGVMSPPASRASSPSKATKSDAAKLVVSPEEFKKMDLGVDLEHLDAPDQTGNGNYNGNSTMELHGLYEDTVLILEEQTGGPGGGEFGSDAKKPVKRFNLNTAGSKPASRSASPGGILTRGRARANGRTRGTVGLSNLGNTCYMNSALQCIRSVEELALYFLSKHWGPEINASNPLGHGGKMAKHYAELVEMIYSEKASSSVTPSAFKRQLGNSQPMFSGYGQQDSQEFLSFLVDALHEDLNRIVKKPYNENPDSDDARVRDPEYVVELGEIYRRNHRARNDSVAMDLFNGFYKNTMECPTCEKVSVTFDPFSLLTVQLPIENTISHPITFIPLTGKPVIHQVEMDKNSSIKMLKEYIASQHAATTADRLWMVEIYSQKIYKVFENSAILGEQNIQSNDHLFVFELEQTPMNHPERSGYTTALFSRNNEIPDMNHKKADVFAVPVFSRQRRGNTSSMELILHPLYITVTREEAQDFARIQKKVLYAVAQQTSRPILTEFDKSAQSEVPSTNGDATDKDESIEDVARVSDRSTSSDEFVNVSLHKSGELAQGTKGTGASTAHVPLNFFDEDYELPAELRNQLFTIKYASASSDGGLHCASMSSFDDRTIGTMLERVRQPEVDDAVQSHTSPEDSTDAASPTADDEAEESDADDDENQGDTEDKPDIIIGGGADTTANGEEDSEDELPKDPWAERKDRNGRANKFNGRRGGKRNKKTYSKKKNKRDNNRNHAWPDSNASIDPKRSKGTGFPSKLVQQKKQSENSGETFYVKLGEAIVLDWTPEGVDALFGGEPNAEDDFRGYWLSHRDGKGLSVVIDPVLEAKQAKRQHRKKNGVTLEDCFAETGKREILSEDNAWYCNRCKEMRQAAKTLEIWTAPDILIVHLKRFASVRNFRDKLDVFVDYPIEGLDLRDRIGLKEDGKDYVYDLFAVDNHYGGLGGGHYTAFAKNFFDGQWYDYNDSSCSKLGDARVHSPAAYLLFYRRRSASPLGGPKLQDLVDAFRNPLSGSETEDATDINESGEVKLGGQTLSSSQPLPGSPSAGIAAGAVESHETLASRAAGGGTSREAIGALIRQPARMTRAVSDEDEAIDMGGGLPFGTQGNGSWSFSGLDDDPAPTDSLLDHVSGVGGYEDFYNMGGGAARSDNDSTAAQGDVGDQDDGGYDSASNMEMLDSPTYRVSAGGGNTPVDEDMGVSDDHALYTHGRHVEDAFHIESADRTDESPPAHEILLPDSTTGEESSNVLHRRD
ncbi:UCH-domain-containing protein [Teratosphaeria destructans]|uniref:ubiquitinyl hydrolase 1 n=1 Tax=Teratosphaeria destructans TaxID=418781 RepID=A0A9W7W2Q6_9PEZI|nr:UCH-domain-containing protein [Teratosphaeria destructans]